MSDDHEILADGPLADAVRAAVDSGEEGVIDEAFIVGDSDDGPSVVRADELARAMLAKSLAGFDSDRIHSEANNSAVMDVAKSVAGSTQSKAEIGQTDLTQLKVVETPYSPELMAAFLEVDDTHFRCVRTKVSDSVGREYELVPTEPVKPDDDSGGDTPVTVAQSAVDAEVAAAREFIEDANDLIGFEGVLDRAAMDHEGIGWAAIEVIRSRDFKVRKIAHLPANRVKVLRGWKGFVEIKDSTRHTWYVPFGSKVVSSTRMSPIDDEPLPYDPKEDGELSASSVDWNLVDRDTGRITSDFNNSANEILWIPKHHSNTIYYGYTDVVPALGQLLSNVHIRDYLLQFFEHNTIPRYAIVIEGAKLADNVKKAITEYFSTHIKGKAHKTLIIPIPSMKGEVKLRFEKLTADQQEGSFQETRKNNAQSILTAHGVSPAIIGINDAASLGSGKGLSQAEIYKDRIVTPLQRRWAHQLNQLFRLGLGLQLIALRFNPLDIRDREAEQKLLTAYLEKGSMTINELRKRAGLGDPIVGGDRAFILTPQGIVFVDELSAASGAELQAMEDELDTLKDEMALQSVKDSMKTEAPNGGSVLSPASR
jgi:capsid portal protein